MKKEKANVVSNYQNHFCLSLQAVWDWSSFFFYVIGNRCPFFSYSKHQLSIHLPHLEQPQPYTATHPWYSSLFCEPSKHPLQIFGQLLVCIYLFCFSWPEPKLCCVSKTLETLQTAGDITKPCNMSYCYSTAHYTESLLFSPPALFISLPFGGWYQSLMWWKCILFSLLCRLICCLCELWQNSWIAISYGALIYFNNLPHSSVTIWWTQL